MSLSMDLWDAVKDIPGVKVSSIRRDVELHGEKAVQARVVIEQPDDSAQWAVVGTFTTEDKDGFGGVDFDLRKDVPGLMASKVRSVLNGTAELTN